jgi:hypothetical protein
MSIPPSSIPRQAKVKSYAPYLLGLLFFIVFIVLLNKSKSDPKQPEPEKPEVVKTIEEKVSDMFYSSGENKTLSTAFMMKYNGYKHLKTNHSMEGDNIRVTTLFRGDGVLHTFDVLLDQNGKMISGKELQ